MKGGLNFGTGAPGEWVLKSTLEGALKAITLMNHAPSAHESVVETPIVDWGERMQLREAQPGRFAPLYLPWDLQNGKLPVLDQLHPGQPARNL